MRAESVGTAPARRTEGAHAGPGGSTVGASRHRTNPDPCSAEAGLTVEGSTTLMIELLTGLGLAMSAGLNAYVPLLVLGLLTRYTSIVELPQQWAWLGNGWVLVVLAVLLVVEVVTDKVPAVDHLNDLLHTLIRPVAGGVVFASGSSSVADASADLGAGDGTLGPFIAGLVVALLVHITKAAGRSVVNLSTAGIGAPVLSTVEDGFSVAIAVVAVLAPLLVLVLIVAGIVLGVWVLRRRWERRRRHHVPQ